MEDEIDVMAEEEADEDLGAILMNEVRSLRALSGRIQKMVDAEVVFERMLKTLEFRGRAATRMATVLKAMRALEGDSGLDFDIKKMADEVRREMEAELAQKKLQSSTGSAYLPHAGGSTGDTDPDADCPDEGSDINRAADPLSRQAARPGGDADGTETP